MNKKVRNNVIAIATMVVLSFGIITCIKFSQGENGSDVKTEAIELGGYTSELATIQTAAKVLDGADAVSGYKVIVESVGFNAQAPIVMDITFDVDKATVKEFVVVTQEETPGLGAKIADDEFKNTIISLTAPISTADMEAGTSSFDQLTGATLSSKAVANAVNVAYDFLQTVVQ